MATITQRGLASVNGVGGTIKFATVAIWPVSQTFKASQHWEEEVVKDVNGFDAAWIARNEHMMFDIGVKFTADSSTDAAAPLSGGGSGNTALSALGQPFTVPLGSMVIMACTLPALNGTYQILAGGEVDQGNTKIADGMFHLRRYADSTQNTAANSTPL